MRLEAGQAGISRDYSEVIRGRAARECPQRRMEPDGWENVLSPAIPAPCSAITSVCYARISASRTAIAISPTTGRSSRVCPIGQRVMLIGHHKGRDARTDRIAIRLANPDGYRKALRCMKLAEKFHVPVVSDRHSGAYPGVESEERGIAYAIAVNLMEMSRFADADRSVRHR